MKSYMFSNLAYSSSVPSLLVVCAKLHIERIKRYKFDIRILLILNKAGAGVIKT